jgi:hypothetical protein
MEINDRLERTTLEVKISWHFGVHLPQPAIQAEHDMADVPQKQYAPIGYL